MKLTPTRRDALVLGGGLAGGAALSTFGRQEGFGGTGPGGRKYGKDLEYVWLSAHAHLPLFVGRDHPALKLAGEELGVTVTIAGPETVDKPALVAAIEQTAARKPAGMMVVGWDATLLVKPIDNAVAAGIPVVCVDADVPTSKRYAFIGTDWTDIGVRQAEAMVKALNGRKGTVALLGLVDQNIDLLAFAGFRGVAEKAGLSVLPPVHDEGKQDVATRVAAAVLQREKDLVGVAGFDSESGPGMGQAIKEAGRVGRVIATCVDTSEQHLKLLREGVLTACVGQNRELFTYMGVKVLHDIVHSPFPLTPEERAMGRTPVPVNFNTGTYTVTRDNVDQLRQ
ncbi:MAG: substrate-binding domain-containing protein [Gemmataceae bacterium]